jgi:hypothetical protein
MGRLEIDLETQLTASTSGSRSTVNFISSPFSLTFESLNQSLLFTQFFNPHPLYLYIVVRSNQPIKLWEVGKTAGHTQ